MSEENNQQSEDETDNPRSSEDTRYDSRRYVRRIYSLVMRPTETWEQIVAEQDERGTEYARYYLPSVLLWLVGSTLGYLILGVPYPVQDRVTGEVSIDWLFPDQGAIVIQQLAFAFFYCLLPFVLAKPLSFITKLFSHIKGEDGRKLGTIADARRLLLYSYAPVLAASAVQAVPVVAIISLVVTIQGLFIFYKGIHPVMGVVKSSRLGFFLVSMVLLLFYNTLVFLLCQDIIGSPYEDALANLPSPETP